MHHFCDTIFVEWAKGEEFYKLYNEQPFICFKHYDFIMNVATQKSKLPSASTAILCRNGRSYKKLSFVTQRGYNILLLNV